MGLHGLFLFDYMLDAHTLLEKLVSRWLDMLAMEEGDLAARRAELWQVSGELHVPSEMF